MTAAVPPLDEIAEAARTEKLLAVPRPTSCALALRHGNIMTTAKRSPMEILFAPFRTPVGKKVFFIAGFSLLDFYCFAFHSTAVHH
jgi:hypothetical protein